MSTRPDDGAERIYFVLGQNCIRIYDWNEHYIKDNAINDVIVFDVSTQKYFTWEEFIEESLRESSWLGETAESNARKNLRRLRFKVYLPVENIPRKKVLKTKKKIENKYICTPSNSSK